MKISTGGGIKKELYHHHYEKVIDKAYNERKKVKKPNFLVALGLSIIPNIVAIGAGIFCGGNFALLFVILYMNFMTCVMITHSIQEMLLNKRMFAWSIVFNFIMITITGLLWAFYLNFLNSFFLCIIIMLVITSFIFCSYLLIAWLLTLKKEKNTCTLKIKAICVGYQEELVDRYVDNNAHSKYNRATSVAYGNEEEVMVYTPIFCFMLDSVKYEAIPNFKINTKNFDVGQIYDIYINPNNPNECRV